MTALDWIKFLPGWFAAVVASWTLIDKWRTRRHKLALGPDDDALRAQLALLRRLFKEIREHGRRKDWFRPDDRSDLDETLLDLAFRRTDTDLQTYVSDAGLAWRRARLNAPPVPGPRISRSGARATPKERTQAQKEKQQFRIQRGCAERGLLAIREALNRLNELEERTIGRP